MELFRLFGTILVNNDKANAQIYESEKRSREVAKALEDATKAAGEMALGLAAAGAAALTAIGIKAVGAADELNKAMNTLQAQTGATDAEMQQFEESTKRLYAANYGQSFEDIAKSMSEIARTTGLTGAELETTTKNALSLRDTFELGVNETARTANSLMKNFGITADQAYTLIAQGAQQGANKNGDLLDTLNEYSVQYKALGFSAEEFTATLIDGAKNGSFSIDKVGDAIKEFTIRSKDGSKTSAAAFEQLGFNAQDMTKAFAEGGEVARYAFDEVTSAISAIEDPVLKNTIGVQLFGTQFEDLEAGAIEALGNIKTTLDQNADTLQKINDVKYDSFGEAIKGVGRQLEVGFFIPLGEKILPKLNELAKWIQDNMPAIQEKMGTAVEVLGGLWNGLSKAVSFVIDNFKIFGPIIAGVTGLIIAQQVVGIITNLYKAWQLATTSMTTVQWLLNAAMAANPFGLIALAVGVVIAAIVALVMNWDWVKEKALLLWGFLKEIFINRFETLKAAFFALKDGAKKAFEGLVSVIKVPINLYISYINLMISTVEKLINFLGSAVNKIPSLKIPEWIPGIGGKELKLPVIPEIKLPRIPMLAEGGFITEPGIAMVGEQGPEILDLPGGASVIPLDKAGDGQIVINIHNPHIFNDRDAEKLGDLLTRYLKNKGVVPRGV
jgi:TP901 family phage tail tape measure protein